MTSALYIRNCLKKSKGKSLQTGEKNEKQNIYHTVGTVPKSNRKIA
jgi:hypothetical protein